MSQGLFTAASALAAQQERLDALANDVANISTPGYRRQRVAFRDLAYDAAAVGSGVAAGTLGRSQAPGPLVASDNPLAVAIAGDGYFQVRLPDGRLALTRLGDFRFDAGGALVTASGLRLEPPITVPSGTKPQTVRITPSGEVIVGDAKVGSLVVVDVPAATGLVAIGDGVFVPTAASGAPAPVRGAAVRQGYLEASNVDLGQAMTDMVEAQRAFQLASRAVRTQDELLEIANGIRR